MPMTDTEPERPDDTWLREGGNEDVADYIVAVVQRADRAEAEVERLKAVDKFYRQLKSRIEDEYGHEWDKAEREVFDSNNQGYLMIVAEAFNLRHTAHEQDIEAAYRIGWSAGVYIASNGDPVDGSDDVDDCFARFKAQKGGSA